jgi:hypothetical protein
MEHIGHAGSHGIAWSLSVETLSFDHCVAQVGVLCWGVEVMVLLSHGMSRIKDRSEACNSTRQGLPGKTTTRWISTAAPKKSASILITAATSVSVCSEQ